MTYPTSQSQTKTTKTTKKLASGSLPVMRKGLHVGDLDARHVDRWWPQTVTDPPRWPAGTSSPPASRNATAVSGSP